MTPPDDRGPPSPLVPDLARRGALAGVVGLLAASCGGARLAGRRADEGPDVDLPATEDLMREHGVLRRLLLVYDEVARRAGADVDPAVVADAARLVRRFVEDYHERAEERWVFPVLRGVPALATTVETLRVQHQRGRTLTDEVLRLVEAGRRRDATSGARLAARCASFARMYRPHAAREDTVVFPALRAHLAAGPFHALGERMEEAEHATVGEDGFARAVAEVARLEQALGLDDLARVTPADGPSQ